MGSELEVFVKDATVFSNTMEWRLGHGNGERAEKLKRPAVLWKGLDAGKGAGCQRENGRLGIVGLEEYTASLRLESFWLAHSK